MTGEFYGFVSSRQTSRLLKLISPDSETLQALNEDFAAIPSLPEINSFYETRRIRGGGKVVEKQSAFLGFPNERLISMNTDHINLMKYATVDSEGYRLVSNAIKRLTSKLPAIAAPHSDETAARGGDGLGRTSVEEFYGLTDVEISSLPPNDGREKIERFQQELPRVFGTRTIVDQTARYAFDLLSEFSDLETGR